MRAGGTVAGSPAESLLLYCRALRSGDDVTASVYAGLFEKAEPIYGRPCRHYTCRLERQSQWDGADGVVCQRDREAGLDSPAGYLGSAIKGASLRWQRGPFFLLLPEHLSVSFADSSPPREVARRQPCRRGNAFALQPKICYTGHDTMIGRHLHEVFSCN